MAINSTSATGAATSASSALAGSNKASIANNFDQFLLLLTTQLKNQSPLDPLDTNQFTQQLVQFASVEQQLKTNDTLSSLIALTKANTATNALNYVGTTVTADGATATLANGSAQWAFNAPRAGDAVITIKDKSGNVVATANRTLTAGQQSFGWNGKTSTGTNAPGGDYTLTIAARDATGAAMTVATEITGTVESVDLSGDLPALKIGNISVPLDKVKAIVRS